MSKLLHKHETNFTIIPNELLHSKGLKLKDIGLLCYLLSLPDDWEFSINGLNVLLENDGRESIRSSLEAVKREGYMQKVQRRDKDGKMSSCEWWVSDMPISENLLTENSRQTKKEYKKENNKKEKINKERNTRYAVSEEHSDLELVQVEGGYYAWRRKQ